MLSWNYDNLKNCKKNIDWIVQLEMKAYYIVAILLLSFVDKDFLLIFFYCETHKIVNYTVC